MSTTIEQDDELTEVQARNPKGPRLLKQDYYMDYRSRPDHIHDQATAKQTNLNYVRAAIFQATGIHLTLEKTLWYLVEEGLITKKEAAKVTPYPDYARYFTRTKDEPNKKEIIVKPVDWVIQ